MYRLSSRYSKKGEEIRISTVDEALEYLRLTNPDDEG